jgi:hypothetical protein
VQGETRWVVVPDFFGDDMVFGPFDPARLPRHRLRLPTENFVLNLMDQGSAQVMCVWQSAKQEATAVCSESVKPPIMAGCEIQAAKDKNIWVACLEGTDLWHERTIAAKEEGAAVTLDWKPPFPAKWRADLLGGAVQSWYFRDPDNAGEALPGAKQPDHPCCFEAGRAVVHWPKGLPTTPGHEASLLVYAMDRNQATPLTAFCPIDILRNTLGVGPCQYILQTEGLASDTNPTPDSVMTFVEKQFKQKKQKKAATEIRELLGQMVEHVGQADARLERYRRFAAEARTLCEAAGAGKPLPAGSVNLAAIAGQLEQTAVRATSAHHPARAKQLADATAALTGKDNALGEVEALGEELRLLGAAQDRALANCRMAARWLKQSAAMMIEDEPHSTETAKKVQTLAEQMLQTK